MRDRSSSRPVHASHLPSSCKMAVPRVARAISPLAEVGAPSWGMASDHVEKWPQTFSAACTEVFKNEISPVDSKWVSIYARLSVMISSYYIIMMRASGEIGPGITEISPPSTALVYMA